jgi:hypothetical protein
VLSPLLDDDGSLPQVKDDLSIEQFVAQLVVVLAIISKV